MANLIVLYTHSKPEDLYILRGYQKLLASLYSLGYKIHLTSMQDHPQLCGYLDEFVPAHFTIPTISLSKLEESNVLANCLVELITAANLNLLQMSANKTQLIKFHSHYKYLIMAYSQIGYRQLGSFVATIQQLTPSLLVTYRQQLFNLISKGYNISNQVNTLKHLQGYFRPYLSSQNKKQLTDLIDNYRLGKETLIHVLQVLNDYLAIYPNDYLSHQYYLKGYLKLLLSVAAVSC